MSNQLRYRSWIKGARWSGISEFLRKEAWGLGLDIELFRERQLWLWETVYFSVTGEQVAIAKFRTRVGYAVKAHNQGPNIQNH